MVEHCHDSKTEMSPWNTIPSTDGIHIFFKDWGGGPPIVFSHGWPLSTDDWDAQSPESGLSCHCA